LRRRIPPALQAVAKPIALHARSMLILEGCVQPALSPNINAATARVLDKLGITVKHAARAGCCGALSRHLDAHEEALNFARRNIDAWWPFVESAEQAPREQLPRASSGTGAEAIVMTASGCGVLVKDYGHLLQDDAQYAAKAARIAAISKDISEILAGEDLSRLTADKTAAKQKIAFHSPCTLQHGQQLDGVVEKLLTNLGFELLTVPDAHLCCGSAGTYSLLQPDLSQRLLENKLENLQSGSPAVILTANIGCLAHMQTKAAVPVRHWIEWVAEAMGKKQ
ncbi:MAG TPA: glycolate oxidase subunit GlcF, partial [Gammaproteobacteria bacterium]|nr:glycolate oxidase subunit GlcF [Gammaproteobacteria bacterium]